MAPVRIIVGVCEDNRATILASAPSHRVSVGKADGIKRRSSLLIRGLIEIPHIPWLLPWLYVSESAPENLPGAY